MLFASINACALTINSQFESTDEVLTDLEDYSFTDNLSDIMDVMDFEDENKANSFANELKKAFQSTPKHTCQEIALSMFKLWDVWLGPKDQTIQQIANLFHIITPKV